MTLEWPISSQRLGHLYLSVFCKGQQIGPSPCYNMPFWLGHNSATGLGHRGAQSLALQEESGPEPFPGGLDADSDVVPTVRCQQERGVRLSAWVWDVVCVKAREKTESLCVCVCVCVCVLARPFSSAQGLSHTRLMAGVEVLKWMLQSYKQSPFIKYDLLLSPLSSI